LSGPISPLWKSPERAPSLKQIDQCGNHVATVSDQRLSDAFEKPQCTARRFHSEAHKQLKPFNSKGFFPHTLQII
jgi:hypothetical protein